MFASLKRALVRMSAGFSSRGSAPPSARPCLETLEKRDLLTATFSISGTVMNITGTGAGEQVLIRDFGTAVDGIDINLNDGAGWRRFFTANITRININMLGGNDLVHYELMDNLRANREVWTNLGSGEDDFLAFLDDGVTGSDILFGANLKLIARGGDGRDFLHVQAAMDVDVGAGSSLLLDLAGEAQADNVFFNYQGKLDGTLFQFIGGQSGNDQVGANLSFDPGSFGFLRGTSAVGVGSTLVPARVNGGNDEDTMEFIIFNNGGVNTRATIDGQDDRDLGFWTSNVTPISITEDVRSVKIA